MDQVPAGRAFVCTNCANNLAGVSYRAACPNCGKPVQSTLQELAPDTSPPPESVPTPIDPSGIVSADLPCLACAYNLRGLNIRANCPECGTPVENSTRGALLTYASPDFIAQLHQGAKLVEWGLIARFLAIAILIGMEVAKLPKAFSIGFAIIAAITVFFISTYGWWQFTNPHIVLRGLDKLRIWTRTFLIIGNLLELLLITSTTGQSPSASALVGTVVRVAPCLIMPLFVAAWLTSIILCLSYCIGIARRTPNPSLASLSTLGAWLVPGLVLGPIPLFFTFIIPLIGWLVAYVFYLVILDRWRAELFTLWKRLSTPATPPPTEGGSPGSHRATSTTVQ